MRGQLQDVHCEFEVDEPAGAELDVQRAARRLMSFDIRPHLGRVADDRLRIAPHLQDRLDHCPDTFLQLRRAEHRASTAQRHMLPSPGFLALILLECVQGDDEHPGAAAGTEARIDFV